MNANDPNRALVYAYLAGRDSMLRDLAMAQARRQQTPQARAGHVKYARKWQRKMLLMLRWARAFTGGSV